MIKISADSTCDLSAQIIEDYDISLVPVNVIVDEESFRDGVDITPQELFKYVEEEGKSCKTAAVNVFEYQNHFQELSSKYEAVIHISLGSGFSSCHQNAYLAAQNFSNVYVIDSQNLSTGQGHLVYEAARMAREGLEPQKICQKLEEMIPRVETSFVIDQLDYLQKGGRCSVLTAQGAKLLRLKPCIELAEGRMTVGKKYRGSFAKCLEKYVVDRLSNRTDIDYSRIFITHAACSQEIVNMVKETVEKLADFQEVIITEAGCTVSTHCGPNTLGILLMRKG